MIILGLNAYHGDLSACIDINGQLLSFAKVMELHPVYYSPALSPPEAEEEKGEGEFGYGTAFH